MLLNQINSLLGLSENDFWPTLPTEVQQAIQKAKLELKQGKGIAHFEVMNEMEQRFLKL